MGTAKVLPLYPLVEAVLLPGETLEVPCVPGWPEEIERRAEAYGAVAASLVDGGSVHEVGVVADVSVESDRALRLRGRERCRLLELMEGEEGLVRLESFPDPQVRVSARAPALLRLLSARASRLARRRGQAVETCAPDDLEGATWRAIAALNLTTEHQQGFLNVPDAVSRARLLLAVIRELELRERFLRPWAGLRAGSEWN